MKKQKLFWAWAMVIGLFFGLTLITDQAMAAVTIGEVINELAISLNMPVADFTAILYPRGFNAKSPVNGSNYVPIYTWP